MKVCIIQPEYSVDYERADELFHKQCELMDRCDESIDIIVLPELCDVPVLASTKEKSEALSEKFHEPLLKKAKETATLPIVTKSSEINALGEAAKRFFELECFARDVFSLTLPVRDEFGKEMTDKLIVL